MKHSGRPNLERTAPILDMGRAVAQGTQTALQIHQAQVNESNSIVDRNMAMEKLPYVLESMKTEILTAQNDLAIKINETPLKLERDRLINEKLQIEITEKGSDLHRERRLKELHDLRRQEQDLIEERAINDYYDENQLSKQINSFDANHNVESYYTDNAIHVENLRKSKKQEHILWVEKMDKGLIALEDQKYKDAEFASMVINENGEESVDPILAAIHADSMEKSKTATQKEKQAAITVANRAEERSRAKLLKQKRATNQQAWDKSLKRANNNPVLAEKFFSNELEMIEMERMQGVEQQKREMYKQDEQLLQMKMENMVTDWFNGNGDSASLTKDIKDWRAKVTKDMTPKEIRILDNEVALRTFQAKDEQLDEQDRLLQDEISEYERKMVNGEEGAFDASGRFGLIDMNNPVADESGFWGAASESGAYLTGHIWDGITFWDDKSAVFNLEETFDSHYWGSWFESKTPLRHTLDGQIDARLKVLESTSTYGMDDEDVRRINLKKRFFNEMKKEIGGGVWHNVSDSLKRDFEKTFGIKFDDGIKYFKDSADGMYGRFRSADKATENLMGLKKFLNSVVPLDDNIAINLQVEKNRIESQRRVNGLRADKTRKALGREADSGTGNVSATQSVIPSKITE